MTNRRTFLMGASALGVAIATPSAFAPPPRTQKSYFAPNFKSAGELAHHLNHIKHPMFMAHRAGFVPFSDVPECSIQAAEVAAKTAPLFIEIDVRTTSDGKLYCVHDATLERNTSGTGEVKATHSDVIKTLFLRAPSGKITDIPVPSFEDFLAWGEGRALLWLDLKDAEPQKVVDLLDKYQAHARVIVSAYGPKRVQAYANIGADLMYFVPVDKKEELDGYIKMGLKPERIIGFSGFDFPKKHLLDAYHAYGIKTLCDLQLDGRLMPY